MQRILHRLAWSLLTALFLALGCATTPDDDSNTHVFRTPEELLANRTAQQRDSWRNLAVTILKEERPGIDASASGDLTITASADGARTTFELAPLEHLLTAQNDRADIILREHFRQHLTRFDQDRMARWTYPRAKPLLRPMFISGSQLADLTQGSASADPASIPTLHNAPGGLRWMVALQWQPGKLTPVGPRAIQAWNQPVAELTAAALSNVSAELTSADVFDTTPFGPLGPSGALKPGINPAVVISPAFLAAVRKQWQITGDLALLIAAPTHIQFVEAENTRLLDVIYPSFKAAIQSQQQALSQSPVRLGDQGVVPLAYQPPAMITPAASQPARNPLSRPTSRPTGTYIVN